MVNHKNAKNNCIGLVLDISRFQGPYQQSKGKGQKAKVQAKAPTIRDLAFLWRIDEIGV